jgi:hypothetical protein
MFGGLNTCMAKQGHLVITVSQCPLSVSVRRAPDLCERNHANGRAIGQAIILRSSTAESLIQSLIGSLLVSSH